MRGAVLWVVGLIGCAGSDGIVDDTGTDGETQVLPSRVDADCTEGLNEGLDSASDLDGSQDQTFEGLELCENETDVYALHIPPGQWVSVAVEIHDGGDGSSDLDLVELDAQEAVVWASSAAQDYERLAWYNQDDTVVTRYLRVEGYRGGSSSYDLVVRSMPYFRGLDCDTFFPDANPRSEEGPCNEILQHPFPSGSSEDLGYWPEHEPHYSNLRLEVSLLINYAAEETHRAFPDTKPVAFMDMSERDGSTPGTMVEQLRHPEGTHVYGNDVDIAYFQTGADNAGRPVCENDGYYCTQTPHLLDARRTAFFMAKLLENPHVRVIGVDTMVAPMVREAAQELVDEGILPSSAYSRISSHLAYGDGWPFHHHHMHFSWNWEDGHWRGAIPEGCMTAPGLYTARK